MKKLISLVVATIMLFMGSVSCFGTSPEEYGVDKIEIFSNGINIVYISMKNIYNYMHKVGEMREANLKKKYSSNQNVLMKTATTIIGIADAVITPILAYNSYQNQKEGGYPYLAFGAWALTGILTFGGCVIGWMCPEKVNADVLLKDKFYFSPLHKSLRIENAISEFIDPYNGKLKLREYHEYKQAIKNGNIRSEEIGTEYLDFSNFPYRVENDRELLELDEYPRKNPYYGIVVIEYPEKGQADKMENRFRVLSQYPDSGRWVKDYIFDKNPGLRVVKTVYPKD